MTITERIAILLGAVTLSTFLVLGSLATASAVGDNSYTRSTLRGVSGVYVAVGELNPAIEGSGLTTAMLKADTKLKLTMAGIKVLTKEEWTKTKGGPVCYVEINVVKDSILTEALNCNLYTFEVSVELDQDVLLVRDEAIIALSPTWSTSYLGITNSIPRIRVKAGEMIQRFINAYQAVNPEYLNKRTQRAKRATME